MGPFLLQEDNDGKSDKTKKMKIFNKIYIEKRSYLNMSYIYFLLIDNQLLKISFKCSPK